MITTVYLLLAALTLNTPLPHVAIAPHAGVLRIAVVGDTGEGSDNARRTADARHDAVRRRPERRRRRRGTARIHLTENDLAHRRRPSSDRLLRLHTMTIRFFDGEGKAISKPFVFRR